MTIAQTTLTILVDNTPGGETLPSEHGWSCVIHRDNRQILFDTGQSDLVQRNAITLGIDLHATDAIVLSHGHYDHTGGLRGLLEAGIRPPIYMHPDAMHPHYGRDPDGRVRYIGSPIDADAIRAVAAIVPITAPTEILAGVFATGPVPRMNDFEDVGGDFWCDAACTMPDRVIDDQSLFFEGHSGWVVVLGCAHAGVINTLRYVQQITGSRRVDTVIGGMHLPHASAHRIASTIEALRELNVGCICPLHCTGESACSMLREHLPGRIVILRTGSTQTW